MALAKPLQDLVYATYVAHPDLALPLFGRRGPAGFGEGTVHVPLDKGDLVLREQTVKDGEEVISDLFLGEVQDELVAALGSWTVGEVIDPVGVDHLGLDPQTEAHA